MALTTPQKRELVNRLLDCPCLATPAQRETVVQQLAPAIRNNIVIGEQASATMYVMAVLNTCLDYPNGLEQLLSAIQFFDGGSTPWLQLNQYLQTIPANRATAPEPAPAEPPPRPGKVDVTTLRGPLRTYLENRFELDELINIAFDAGFDYAPDEGAATRQSNKSELVRELIRFCEKRGEIPTLIRLALAQQPDPYFRQIIQALLPDERFDLVEIDLNHETLSGPEEIKTALTTLTRQRLRAAVAAWTGVLPQQVVQMALQPGSVRLLFSLPAQAARRLLSLNPEGLTVGSFRVRRIVDFYALPVAQQKQWREVYQNPVFVLPPGGNRGIGGMGRGSLFILVLTWVVTALSLGGMIYFVAEQFQASTPTAAVAVPTNTATSRPATNPPDTPTTTTNPTTATTTRVVPTPTTPTLPITTTTIPTTTSVLTTTSIPTTTVPPPLLTIDKLDASPISQTLYCNKAGTLVFTASITSQNPLRSVTVTYRFVSSPTTPTATRPVIIAKTTLALTPVFSTLPPATVIPMSQLRRGSLYGARTDVSPPGNGKFVYFVVAQDSQGNRVQSEPQEVLIFVDNTVC